MNTIKNKSRIEMKSLSSKERQEWIFLKMNPWRAVLKMAIPNIIMMLVVSSYLFFDQVLSINLAGDKYGAAGGTAVRLAFSFAGPIAALTQAFGLLFAMGTAARVSVFLGRGDQSGARRVFGNGGVFGLALILLMSVVLTFVGKSWIASQSGGHSPVLEAAAWKYIIIIIWSAPFTFLTNLLAASFRAESKNLPSLIAMTLPMFLNLFLDWLFMGPVGMGVEGGAWATFIATGVGLLFILGFWILDKDTITKHIFKDFKFKWVLIFAILLMGVAPFMRNFAQSLTGSLENTVLRTLPDGLINTGTGFVPTWTMFFSASMPIVMLLFPCVFAFIQAARPIAGYAYGAKDYKRVKQIVWVTFGYALIFTLVIYGIIWTPAANGLLNILGVGEEKDLIHVLAQKDWAGVSIKSSQDFMDYSLHVLRVTMVGIPISAFSVIGMVMFSSTDRPLLSLLASTLRGIFVFIPLLFIFAAITNSSGNIEIIWWMYPAASFVAAAITFSIFLFVQSRFGKNERTLEERIESGRMNKIFGKKKIAEAAHDNN